jgi:putative transposase
VIPTSGVVSGGPHLCNRGGPCTSGDQLHGWHCKGWAGPFPWFEYHLNQTRHAQTPSCRPALASLLDGNSAGELIPELARRGLQQLIELEVAAFLGADKHERSEKGLGHRNGYRSRTLTTQVGDLAQQIPKLRAGSVLPSILDLRRQVEQALYAVIMEATIGEVSTRKVDSLVAALGSRSGISKSQVSCLIEEIDQQVQAFRRQPLDRVSPG